MEEPYDTIQDIGKIVEQLAAERDATPAQVFEDTQKQLNRLAEIKFNKISLPVDWEQYIASIETTLHRIQAEVRPQINPHQASQLTIKAQADHTWSKVKDQEEAHNKRHIREEKLKSIAMAASAVFFIFLLAGIFVFYQWSLLTSDEGWFHDLAKKDWSAIEDHLRLGKSIETVDHMGMTGLLYLARTGSPEDLQQMVKLGANLNAKDNHGRTALHHAAANAERSTVAWLVSQGIDVNTPDNTGTTPLHYFFVKAPGSRNAFATYQYLLDQGAKTDTSNHEESLLMAAVLWVRGGAFDERPAEILQLIIDQGANVNHRGLNGATALDNALVKYLPRTPSPITLIDSDPLVKVLLQNGATQEEQTLSLTDELQPQEQQRVEFAPGL